MQVNVVSDDHSDRWLIFARMHQLFHLLFEVVAFALGYTYFQRLRLQHGDHIAEPRRVWIIIGAAAGALIGSRVLGALENPAALAWSWKGLFIAFNNRTIVGGLLGGLIGVEITKRIIGERKRSGDLFVSPLLLGMIIGRIGCMLGGLEDNTFGTATDLPWGIDLGDGVRRHPTNLYEITWLGGTWLMLRAIERRWPLIEGARFQLFMVLYLFFRFLMESIKPDPAVLFGLSAIQIACLLGLMYYYRIWTSPTSLFQQPRINTDGQT